MMAPNYTELNYFTCTLGHAAVLKEQNPTASSFKNALHLIQAQAERYPESPAVGFANFGHGHHPTWFNFSQLDESSLHASQIVSKCLSIDHRQSGNGTERVAALLCPSNVDFLFTWLGLMRLGYTVLFLA
jgi:acyl-CoA synthetase (AMP-forming)/AMP-acid ligase II